MTDYPSSPLKLGAIERLLDSAHVTHATRSALKARLAWKADPQPICFTAAEFAVLAAVCDRLVPQLEPGRQVPLAAMLDTSLAKGSNDGWRYDAMPPDPTAFRSGMGGIAGLARRRHGADFVDLDAQSQDAILATVQKGEVEGDPWAVLSAPRFFEELLARVVELFYAHPHGQARIGYIGMADAQGFHALGLNRRDPVEDEASAHGV